ALERAIQTSPVVVVADPETCHFQVDPTGTKKFPSSCDIATRLLTGASVSYTIQEAPAGTVASVKVGDTSFQSFNAVMTPDNLNYDTDSKSKESTLKTQVTGALKSAGYQTKADPESINSPMLLLLLFILVLYVTMVYGTFSAKLL